MCKKSVQCRNAMRKLLALVPWMAMTAAWASSTDHVSLAYGHYAETASTSLRIGGACWVPLNLAGSIGWKIKSVGEGVAEIQSEGRSIRVPVRVVDGVPYIGMEEVVRQLGALSWWDGTTYRVTGELRNLSLEGSRVKVDGTLGFKTNSFLLSNPNRLVIDFVGLSLPSNPEFDLPAGVRLGQNNQNTVRLVIEHPQIRLPRTSRPNSARFFDLDLAPFKFGTAPIEPQFNLPPKLRPEDMAQPSGGTATTVSKPGPVTPPTAPPRLLRAIQRGATTEQQESLIFMWDTPSTSVPSIRYVDPTTVVIEAGNSTLDSGLNEVAASELIRQVQVEQLSGNIVRATIRTKQPILFQASAQSNFTSVLLRKPKNADGKLRGKTIVVDAGHGGNDSGANWKDPRVMEKTIVLAVSNYLAEDLMDEGANVIMTRTTDVRIALGERAAIANRSKADVFISVHVNSNKLNNSRSGTITFHHMQEPDGKLLATCIHAELVKATKLPNIGIWSDSRIYQSGFAVLRQTQMPAVLLELGFINHSTDRSKMVQTAWQQDVALSIVKGLKVYFGDVKQEVQP